MDQLFRFLDMGLTPFETIAVWAVLGIAVIGLLYAVYLRRQILAEAVSYTHLTLPTNREV